MADVEGIIHRIKFKVSFHDSNLKQFISSPKGINKACKLFGCSPEQLVNILITRTVHSATDKVTTHLSKTDVSKAFFACEMGNILSLTTVH